MPGDSILIVDDNVVNLRLVHVLLTTEGYNVQTAPDALEALTILHTFHPRLIVVDIQLPGMDGIELTRRLKADPTTRDIIIVAISADAMKWDVEKALAAGCDGYLPRPIDTRTVPSTISRYLAWARSADGPPELV